MHKSSQTPWGVYRVLLLIFTVASLYMGWGWSPAAANGVPVQIFLEHTPFKATWSPAAGGHGMAVVAANDEQVRVMAQNLPAPPAPKVYYAWLEQAAGGFLPVGILDYNSDGTASLTQTVRDLPYSENFSWVLVSVEDPGQVGSAPGPEIALAGRLPNAMALPHQVDQLPALLPVTGAEEAVGALAAWRWFGLGLGLVAVVFVAVAWRRATASLAGRRIRRLQGEEP